MVVCSIAASGCGGAKIAGGSAVPRTSVAVGAGRPSLTVVEREGDARGAVAIAVTTEGIAPERGAAVAVALASLVEERLASRGFAEASAVAGWDGWRLRALVSSPAAAAKFVEMARDAMLEPVGPQDPALAAVAKRLEALAHRPLPDRALADVARCTGEAYGIGDEATPNAAEIEAWRRSAHGLQRIAVATAGDASLADAVAASLAHSRAWPSGAPVVATSWPTSDAPPLVYDASGEIAPGAARIVVTVRTTAPERAVAAAPALGDPRGPLASRLAALDAPGRVRSVVATAHAGGGCVAATVDLSARDIARDVAGRIATAAALARQELTVEIADVAAPPDLRRVLAMRAPDPREAAETAAWWEVSTARAGHDELRSGLAVGVAATRDPSEPVTGGAQARPAGRGVSAVADAIRAEIDRATAAWRETVLEARTRVERGQGETWVLLASPCGTLPEASHDAGTGAAVATAAVLRAADETGDARLEPFVVADGVGVLAHGPARAGESPQAHARRLADLAGRAFAADALDAGRVSRARATLLARASQLDARALAALGGALAPGHPSWVDPWGTSSGLGSASDDTIAMRASAIRAGPLRVAVLANVDEAQADAAVRAVDRWVARRPGEERSCPQLPTPGIIRPGTYAVELPAKAQSEALLAIPLPPGDDAAKTAANWVAAALDGPGGLLAGAIGGTGRVDPTGASSTRAWSTVLGSPRAPSLVVRLVAPDALLDASVAQTRAVLDRLHQGALREADRARADVALAAASVDASLDPRTRVIDLWRGDAASGADRGATPAPRTVGPSAPSLAALRAFASAQLRDDALVIVAARPPRGDADAPSVGRESKGSSRESERP
jgi:hypothetical protein